ncbi:expressed unknown protein [Seminavis robusta]|uniref:Peptidylprolyl isomerase n=1 Tax=Seminavis robusta TaxID=568900 RepID=A0A9N8EZN9_9STRA|nr:expressed unknown protein [Seminavis robusta]|eukprot:Sro2248_g320670.1 n/a (308) ;mRNA; f:3466-4614
MELLLLLAALLFHDASSFRPLSCQRRHQRTNQQSLVLNAAEENGQHEDSLQSRRQILTTAIASAVTLSAESASALVKGVAPPSSMKPSSGKPKCTNVEECQAMAERKEQEERETAEGSRVPAKKTPGGVIYRDEQEGNGGVVKDGDEVTLYYKVLKLGKRSYDGLSGEGTVVFSRGYGLEDDEKKPGDKSFITTVGAFSNVVALNEALIGMKEGGIRRIAVLPQKGWRKPTAQCDGGPGGQGQGGDLRTDYVVVPTATMVEQEACFDTTRQPFPATYAQQRRMAQRFDQSLIMEVEVSSIASSSSLQ